MKEHCVYFVQAGAAGPIKIGFTANLTKRLESIQNGNPERLRTILVLPVGHEVTARAVESSLHSMFDEERIGRSEWFRPHQDITDLCAKLTEVGSLRGGFVLAFDIVRGPGGVVLRPGRRP